MNEQQRSTDPIAVAAPQTQKSLGWYLAKTTAKTTGLVVTADIYANGSTKKDGTAGAAVATHLAQSIRCQMLAAAAVVPIGAWLRVRQNGTGWEGDILVWLPEPV